MIRNWYCPDFIAQHRGDIAPKSCRSVEKAAARAGIAAGYTAGQADVPQIASSRYNFRLAVIEKDFQCGCLCTDAELQQIVFGNLESRLGSANVDRALLPPDSAIERRPRGSTRRDLHREA